jgi:hypothetical protein
VPRAILTRTLAVLTPVLAVCVASAGMGAASPSTRTDRSAKLDLIRKLNHGPQILILGDSRGREAEPSFLRRLTGLRGFNAAVGGGSAPDAWVFTRYTEDLFPRQKRRYIWFVSAGLAGNIIVSQLETDPRSQRYLKEAAPYLSPVQISASFATDTRYRADGSIADFDPTYSPSRARKLRAEAAQSIAELRQKWGPPSAAHPPSLGPLDTSRFRLFEHLVGYMNRLGSRPVIVFTPVYPTLLAALEKYGNPVLTSSLDYLRSVRSRYGFVVLNCEDSRKWGGTDYDWANPTHVGRANMRRMLRYVVAHAGGALK